jgi:Arc/MetJ-type ribon-helix-helix transcriptional regulator
MKAVKSEGHVVGSKVSAVELEEIKKLVAAGVYLNTSDFVRDAIRDKLAAIKTIKYRDVDYETAKKEIRGYFRDRGEAYPSEIEEDLELDYRWNVMRWETPYTATESGQKPERSAIQRL